MNFKTIAKTALSLSLTYSLRPTWTMDEAAERFIELETRIRTRKQLAKELWEAFDVETFNEGLEFNKITYLQWENSVVHYR